MTSGTITFSNLSLAKPRLVSASSFNTSSLVADPLIIDNAVNINRNPPAILKTSISILKKTKIYLPKITK
jgi:hypothetical protein